MTLFDFEYIPYEAKSYVKLTGVNIIDLRAELIGFDILWDLRHKSKCIDKKRETREFLQNRIAYFKRIKREYPFEYGSAQQLAYRCV